jgi:carbamate kinase
MRWAVDMRIVVALGGNALLQRGEKPDAEIQRHHVKRAAAALAPHAAEHDLVICHGNGPQVGLLAVESEADPSLSRPYPLDVLVAQTQGMIGYWLVQELHNAGVDRAIANVTTQTVVDGGDPAFDHPTKFIGASHPERRAHALARRHGWTVAPDGELWRRVVPSPRPVDVVESALLSTLLDNHAVVVCAGGGGAPVVRTPEGLRGVEAVVDKDHAAALIATRFGADRLLVLTDVPAVMADFGTARQRPLGRVTISQLGAMRFPPGSMGPKIEATVAFTRATGNPSSIGRLDEAESVLAGLSGTTVLPDGSVAA